MTYLDKYKEEHPNDAVESDGLPLMCPEGYGYEKHCYCTDKYQRRAAEANISAPATCVPLDVCLTKHCDTH